MTTARETRPSRAAFWVVLLVMAAVVLGLDTGLARSRLHRPPAAKTDANCDSLAPAKPEAAPPASFLAFGACSDDSSTPSPRIK